MRKLYQRKNWSRLFTFFFLLWSFVPLVFAQGHELTDLLPILYRLLLPASIFIGLALIVINGYGLLTSEGEPQKVQNAKDGLTSAIIGIVFVVLSMVLYRLIVTSLIGSGVSEGRPF